MMGAVVVAATPWRRQAWCLVAVVVAGMASLSQACSSPGEMGVCASCESSVLGVSTDKCCSDEALYDLCNVCMEEPEQCQWLLEEAEAAEHEGELEGVSKRATGDYYMGRKRGSSFWYLNGVAPVRRAKYFLGKRSDVKRLRNNFLGKRDNEESYLDSEKRARPFLGKRDRARPFLGKRDYDIDDKRGFRPFLGKRARPFLGKRSADTSDDLKRARPFLGKRDQDDEKRARPFLGKRNFDDEDEKRARPFLGKRDDINDKRARPFLGKRYDTNEDNFSPFLDEVADQLPDSLEDSEKRSRPFLGKRMDFEELKRARPFLGKRGGMRPFLGKKRARPFLGKRMDKTRPFLGKRSHLQDEDLDTLLGRAESFIDNNGIRDSLDKRARPFLGKKDVDES